MTQPTATSTVQISPTQSLTVGALTPAATGQMVQEFAPYIGPIFQFGISGVAGKETNPADLGPILVNFGRCIPAIIAAIIDAASFGDGPRPATDTLPLGVKLELLGAVARHTLDERTPIEIGMTAMLGVMTATANPFQR